MTFWQGWRVSAASAVNRRRRQEDSWGLTETSTGLVAVVCDGMGGPPDGDVASAVVCKAVVTAVASGVPVSVALEQARGMLHRARVGRGSGTTVVGVTLLPDRAEIWHLGDSAAFLLRRSVAADQCTKAYCLVRLTWDHTTPGQLWRGGRITEEQARRYPTRNVLLVCVGPAKSSGIEVESTTVEFREPRFRPPFSLLLCSDGMTEAFTDAQLEDLLATAGTKTDPAQFLVEEAMRAGAKDNATAMVITREVA